MLQLGIVLLCCLSVGADVCRGPICHYQFVIRHAQTMTTKIGNDTFSVVLNGSQLQVASTSFRPQADYSSIIGRSVSADDVITADGFSREVITINDQFPGPTIEVLKGVQIVVNVVNKLSAEVTAVHWHGLDQRGNFYMDGASYVTQCPMAPGQNFTYRFIADPPGTHWYHSHHGSQRFDGLYGTIIIHDDEPQHPQLPILITDWYHIGHASLDVRHGSLIEHPGAGEILSGYRDREYYIDGVELTSLTYVSGLLDGRGRWPSNDVPLPLAEYRLPENGKARFRMTHAGAEYSYEISADGHMISVVAMDGYEIVPSVVESLSIHAGESIDFELVPDVPPAANSVFWLRATTMAIANGPELVTNRGNVTHQLRAILVYGSNSPGNDPTTSPRQCLATKPCRVLNCPYKIYPSGFNKTCLNPNELQSAESQTWLRDAYGLNKQPDVEHFLNFAFVVGSSVNAVRFVPPRALFKRGDNRHITPCPADEECNAKGCKCTKIRQLKYNDTVQLVFLNYQYLPTRPAHHTIHFHGHSFAVLYVGFAEQDSTTAVIAQNTTNGDIVCDTLLCAAARWNTSKSLNSSRLNTRNPILRDTVLLPAQGYVVIRFRADNPGIWMMHCHQELHIIEGMVLVWDEAAERQPPYPPNFPQCGDYDWTEQQFDEYMKGVQPTTTNPPVTNPPASNYSSNLVVPIDVAVGAIFGFVGLGATIPIVAVVIYSLVQKRR